jgi:hypothetical protein
LSSTDIPAENHPVIPVRFSYDELSFSQTFTQNNRQ